jgi:hypothetical protein
MDLLTHIREKNDASRKEMAVTPGLFIGIITEDLHHWAGMGICTVDDYEFYMDSMGLEDWLAEITSKSYARMRIRDCKTTADLEALNSEWEHYVDGKEFA